MTTLFDVGDALRGNRIRITARRISQPIVVNQSGRHKAIRVTARDNAHCVIEVALYPRPKEYQSDS